MEGWEKYKWRCGCIVEWRDGLGKEMMDGWRDGWRGEWVVGWMEKLVDIKWVDDSIKECESETTVTQELRRGV